MQAVKEKLSDMKEMRKAKAEANVSAMCQLYMSEVDVTYSCVTEKKKYIKFNMLY